MVSDNNKMCIRDSHYILHGADIGIETGAYILNVEHNQVYVCLLYTSRCV